MMVQTVVAERATISVVPTASYLLPAVPQVVQPAVAVAGHLVQVPPLASEANKNPGKQERHFVAAEASIQVLQPTVQAVQVAKSGEAATAKK